MMPNYNNLIIHRTMTSVNNSGSRSMNQTTGASQCNKRRKIECQICCEHVWEDSGYKKNHWTCTSCEFSCCQDCARRYLLDSISDPQCMSCNARISRHDLIEGFPKTWVTGTFKKHRENVLLDREKALIPASVEAVERAQNVRNAEALVKQLEEERAKIYRMLYANEESIRAAKNVIRNGGYPDDTTGTDKEGKTFQVVKCQKDGCNAFARKNTKCSACDTLTCFECMEILTGDSLHVCDEEKKETVAIARKQSKPCPGCGEFISKVEGCSQMWCIKCHTTFDYRTGRKVTQAIHNPHYYEYMRRNPSARTRDPRDVQCGGIPDYTEIVNVNRGFQRLCPNQEDRRGVMDIFFNTHRILTHIHHTEIPYYQQNANGGTEALRVSFILKDFDEEEFKIKLQRHEKKQDYRREMLEVFVMIQTAGTDILQRLVHGMGSQVYWSKDGLTQHGMELKNLLTYANSLFCRISGSYSMAMRNLDGNWGHL